MNRFFRSALFPLIIIAALVWLALQTLGGGGTKATPWTTSQAYQQIRDNPQLIRSSSAVGDANAAASTKAGAPVASGQVLLPKIGNVKVYSGPSRDSKVVGTAQRTDEMVASGEVKNGFVQVDATNFSGWVQQTLVSPAPGH